MLSLSGLAEGVGILSLLPLLTVASGGEQSSGLVSGILDALRIPQTAGVLLMLAVVGLVLKNLLFLMGLRMIGYAAADLAANYRTRLVESLSNARWEFVMRRRTGDLSASVGTEANRVFELFVTTSLLASSIIQSVVYLVLATLVSIPVTVSTIAFGVVLTVSLKAVTRMARDSGERETVESQSLLSSLTDGLLAMKPIRAMACEESLLTRLRTDIENLNRTQRRQVLSQAIRLSAHEPLVTAFLALGTYVAILNQFPFQRLLFLAFLFHRLANRLANVQGQYQQVTMLESALHSLEREIAEAQKAPESSPTSAPALPASGVRHDIQFRSVQFSYREKAVFRDLNLSIEASTFVCLSGPSGCGKTTIADLLAGLLVPSDGEILIDDVPMERINIRQWRGSIGYAPQSSFLLHDTIFENVRLGRDVSDAAVNAALTWSCSDSFVDRLPNGAQSVIGADGCNLSGGERQRIVLARAIVHEPSLLILDEVTEALDAATEREVLEAISALDATIVAVSHREQVLQACDRIIRVEDYEHPRPHRATTDIGA